MATYGNDLSSQAPSGSRLAQYLNGRSPMMNATTSNLSYGEQGYGSGYGADETYGMNYSNYGQYGHSPHLDAMRNEELMTISQNIPLLGLQLLNEETLKQRWALSNGNKNFFAEQDLRTFLLQRQMAQQCFPSPNSDLPEIVDQFRYLHAIGRNPVMRFGPHIEHTYKAVSGLDGITYALHRLTNVRPLNAYTMTQIENWRRVTHSNVIRLHSVMPTNAFNDTSHIFVYDFQPLAEPILKHFFHTNGSLKSKYASNGTVGLNEQLAWSFVIQMSSAIRTIHALSMAVRCIDLNRILVNSSGRFTISGVGIPDVLASEPVPNLVALQIEDLRMLGNILNALLVGSVQTTTAEQIGNHYSPDLKNVVKVLCNAQTHPVSGRAISINEIMPMIGARFYSQVEALQCKMDMVENDLCKELQNGRLFRLLSMLSTVCDRNLPKEPYWSETPECYQLKLFRDYVFHQVDGYGRPVVDLAHIVLNLNKLDSGLDEKVRLASQGNENVLLVSYKELRNYLETSFAYLRKEMEGDLKPNVGYSLPYTPEAGMSGR